MSALFPAAPGPRAELGIKKEGRERKKKRERRGRIKKGGNKREERRKEKKSVHSIVKNIYLLD